MTYLVEVDVFIKAQTDLAILTDDDEWLPKSQIVDGDYLETGTDVGIEIPEWLALEKGLI